MKKYILLGGIITIFLIFFVILYQASFMNKEEIKDYLIHSLKIDPNNIEDWKIDLAYADGHLEYEVKFIYDKRKLEYKLNARTGKIIEETSAPIDMKDNFKTNNSKISIDKAKSIALNDANLSEYTVSFLHTKLDTEEGINVYEIEFITANSKYEYEIEVTSGRIIKREIKDLSKQIINDDSRYIGIEKAKEIALSQINNIDKEVNYTNISLGLDRDTYIYELEFFQENREYECEINALTGEIIKFSYDQRR